MLNQLTLGIRLQDEATFGSFYIGDNGEIISALKELVDNPRWYYIYLYGVEGVGKSHLLQAACRYGTSKELRTFYLPLSTDINPSILEDLDHFSLVCLDNIEYALGIPDWEEALFHFFNRSSQNGSRLIIAGKTLPQHIPITLPDLRSRLASGVIYRVIALNDGQKLAALQLRAKLRGFVLSEEVGHYLLNHFPREMEVLFKLLDQLDQFSLQAKHRLTLPFVKSVLKNEGK